MNYARYDIKKINGDYSSFNSFEAGTQGEEDVIVGVISPTPQILLEIEHYLSEKFYEVGPRDLFLFTDSGLLFGYKKSLEWVYVQENLRIALEIPRIKENTP